MIDGYLLVEFNTEGKGRIKVTSGVTELTYVDIRLENLDLGMDDAFSMLEDQFPKELKNVLVMAFFTYKSVSSGGGDYWSQDYEDVFILQSHVVLQENYKEFYRKMLTEELSELRELRLEEEQELDGKMYAQELVGHWEEFYDEDFVETVKPDTKNSIAIGLNLGGE